MKTATVRTLLLILAAVPAGLCIAQSIPATPSARFDALDSNHDGVVSKYEYDSKALFSVLDSDHNYRITAQELQAILGPGGPSAADRIRLADRNQDGQLDDEELRRTAEMRFGWLDRNNNGELDLGELQSGFGIPAPAQ